MLRDCSSRKKPTPNLKKGLREFRAIALLSVFSKWYTTVVDLLHEEKEPIEWRNLHVGAERGVNFEHMQALLTNTYCRDSGSGRKIAEPTWNHDFSDARRLSCQNGARRTKSLCGIKDSVLDRSEWACGGAEMKDVTGFVCFESCETTFRCSNSARRGGGLLVV